MKLRKFFTFFLILFLIQILSLVVFAAGDLEVMQDTVAVNSILQSVQKDWGHLDSYDFGLDYVVLDEKGKIIFRTKEGISETVYDAVAHRDTILAVEKEKKTVGTLLIYNSSAEEFLREKQKIIYFFLAELLIESLACCGYILYLEKNIIHPFEKLREFASRVANGNLDIPLDMDRQNLFGAFTESFDIMRSELKKARMEEAKAQASKKELIAKLSHDIKTPIASIKAVAEVGSAMSEDEKVNANYRQIMQKADQINDLISNLFHATLEELQQLPICPTDVQSNALLELLHNADYLSRADITEVPECLLYFDKLRLQQVFDNLFSNSYKYAQTKIKVSFIKKESYLNVRVEDYGGGVLKEELPLLTEKFKRGSNAKQKDGVGLGLYISNYFMKEMDGKLHLENTDKGFAAMVCIKLSGN